MEYFDNLYVEDGYVEDGYVIEHPSTRPSWAVIPTLTILKSYLYQQYQPDQDVEAFFKSYNTTAQSYLDYINQLNLPVYTSSSISGTLLDWVALNLYGFLRPTISFGNVVIGDGVYNTVLYNTIPYNEGEIVSGQNVGIVNDDIFKRCLTWNLYRGDGYIFTTRWLKNRVYRFLTGTNGIPNVYPDFFTISVVWSSPNIIEITIGDEYSPEIISIFSALLDAGFLNTPFQYSITIV